MAKKVIADDPDFAPHTIGGSVYGGVAMPGTTQNGSPWCDSCQSYHPVPRDAAHKAALMCVAIETSKRPKRPYMRHPPCAVECRCDGSQVYAAIGSPDAAIRGEAGGVIGFGDMLADALRSLADEIEKEVEC